MSLVPRIHLIHTIYPLSYTLRCRVPSYKKEAKMKTVVFNLEVCLIPGVNMIGKSNE